MSETGVTLESLAQWPTVDGPEPAPIAPNRFGKDHYSALAYVETRTVDYRGRLDHDHMRCDGRRHSQLLVAKRRSISFGTHMVDACGKYPTRLRWNPDGSPNEIFDHDDYDCLDDMLACGWLTVGMPEADREKNVFVDARGRVIDPSLVNPAVLTGLTEQILSAYAVWGLTDEGRTAVASLRRHRAEGGGCLSFADLRYPR